MKTIIFYILGILFVTLGLFFIIININLFFIGYSFIQFVNYIISSPQCNIFFIGILILILVYERGKIYDYK